MDETASIRSILHRLNGEPCDGDIIDAIGLIESLGAENARLRGALETLARYNDDLRASGWPGLANVVRDALAGSNGSGTEGNG